MIGSYEKPRQSVPPPPEPAAGRLNSALATAVGSIHTRYVGRGPTRMQAFYRRNVVVVVMEDSMTKAERTLATHGMRDVALLVREQCQETMRDELVEAVETLTGCGVVAFLSSQHVDPDLSSEIFVLDRPLPADRRQ